jgi:cytoskeletal protein CcmA (bactofilin family)
MAGVLIHDVSGYSGSAYNLKIPSLTDPANIQEAMMLFHYGIDSYDGSIEPADASVFGNLRDFDNRIAQLEATEVVQLYGTENQIVSSGSVGLVTLSLPNEIITPGTLRVSGSSSFSEDVLFENNFTSLGSGSVVGNIEVNGNIDASNLSISGSASFTENIEVNGNIDASNLSISGSASFTEKINALGGVNVFTDDTERDSVITSPEIGTIVYLVSTNQQLVYNGSAWVVVESGSGMEDIFLLMGA